MKFCKQHPIFLALAVLFTIAVFQQSWQAGLLLTATLLVCGLFAAWISLVDKDHTRKLHRMKQLEQDVTTQDQLWIQGDPQGTHGRYRPYT